MKLPISNISKLQVINITGGKSAQQILDEYSPDILINGLMYDRSSMQNIVFLMSDGVKSGSYFLNEGIGIKTDGTILWCKGDEPGLIQFIGSAPALIINGVAGLVWGNTESIYLKKSHIRSFIGLSADKELIFGTTKVAVTLEELIQIAFEAGCVYALNLDGGGSTYLNTQGTIVSQSYRSNVSWILVWLKPEAKKLKVVFDIGHGSDTYPPDKGIGTFAEHTFNSNVYVMAKKLAEHNGFEVITPQEPLAPEVKLYPRKDYINSIPGINCLLSFHANANKSSAAFGHGVFYWFTSSKGMRLAKIWDKYAAQLLGIPRWGTGIWESHNRVGSWSNYLILRETYMPAILCEHFFFTNPQELAKCNTPEYVAKCAEVAVRTICEYNGVSFKALGASVGSDKVVIFVNENRMRVFKEGVYTDHKIEPKLFEGRLYLPIRTIAELVINKPNLSWDNINKIATIE